MKFTRRRYQVPVKIPPYIVYPFQREWKLTGRSWSFTLTLQDEPEIPEASRKRSV